MSLAVLGRLGVDTFATLTVLTAAALGLRVLVLRALGVAADAVINDEIRLTVLI